MRFLVCVLLILFAAAARADTLPAVYSNVQFLSGSDREQHIDHSPAPSNSYSLSELNATETASYSLGPDPTVSTTLQYTGPIDNLNYQTVAQVNYQFMVNGPANQTVNVDLAANAMGTISSLTTGGFYATGYIVLGPTSSSTPLLDEQFSAQNANTTAGFAIDQTLTVNTDEAYDISLVTQTGFYSTTGRTLGSYSASASIDPTLTLDTTDPAYSLQFSPGLLSATPEPSTLALAATGLTAGVARLRRRRTS